MVMGVPLVIGGGSVTGGRQIWPCACSGWRYGGFGAVLAREHR
ncbi:hypothetical protein OK006_8339 [Actinobacteria bacterium OK006]|nr:hypothetical protein OK006_8339 [Actinobacteria bacterium OK006]